MSALRWLARPAMAGLYVSDGLDALRHPKERLEQGEPALTPIARRLGLTPEPLTLVRVEGVVQLAAGTMLAFGRRPRLAALALLGTTVPATFGARFWEETGPAGRAQRRTELLRTVSLAGGLLLAVADTAGRPSWSWWSRRAAQRAAVAASGAAGAATGLFGAVEAVAGDAIDAVGDALAKAGAAAEHAVAPLAHTIRS